LKPRVRGTTAYDISGRYGVFAKTDIQPLLNRGRFHADIALSTFHSIANPETLIVYGAALSRPFLIF
jgi:activator of 2-hydroxyglutaryl-CoA dehydratase